MEGTKLDKIEYKVDKEKQIVNMLKKVSNFKKKFFKGKKDLRKEKAKDNKIIEIAENKLENYKEKQKKEETKKEKMKKGGKAIWGSFEYLVDNKIIDKKDYVKSAYKLWGNKCSTKSFQTFKKNYNRDKIGPRSDNKCHVWLQYAPISLAGFDYDLCKVNKYWKTTAHWGFALQYKDRVIQCELTGVFDVFRLVRIHYLITEFKNFDKFFGNGMYKMKLKPVVDISWHDLVLLCNTHPMSEKTYKMVGFNCQDYIYVLFKKMSDYSTNKNDEKQFDDIAKEIDKNRVSKILEQYPNYTEAKKDLGKGFSIEQKFYLDFLVDHYKEYALGSDSFF